MPNYMFYTTLILVFGTWSSNVKTIDDDGEVALCAANFLQHSIATTQLLNSILSSSDGTSVNMHRQRRKMELIRGNLNKWGSLRVFRTSKEKFEKLVDLLSPILRRRNVIALRSILGAISVEVQVALFLRVLSRAQYVDIVMPFGIEWTAVFAIAHRVCSAVPHVLPLSGILTCEQKLKEFATQFCMIRINVYLNKCSIVALDGIAIEIKNPSVVVNLVHFWNRKGYFALWEQTSWNATYMFLS